MNILVCGARGFIGGHIVRELRARGHSVREGIAPAVDFSRHLETSAWLPHIAGVDAVINAVGVLRDSRARPLHAVHHLAPAALFEACAQQGVRRIIHVSALGIDANSTLYARSKLAAEEVLRRLHGQGRLAPTILRPSIVFGRGGASSELFMRLARMPVLLLPGAALRARVQPLVVQDLAAVAAALVEADTPLQLECVGPQQLALADFVGSLRAQLGRSAARVVPMSGWLSRLSARCGDHLPFQPWCSETLALLQKDNVGDGARFAALLQRPVLAPEHMVESAWMA